MLRRVNNSKWLFIAPLFLSGCDLWFDHFPGTSTSSDEGPETASDSGDSAGPDDPCPPGLTGESCERCLLYVDGSQGNDAWSGRSWAKALATVTEGLARASGDGCEVWVAAGTYVPTTGPSPEERTFQMEEGVDLYGGFSGIEVNRDERDILTHTTILEGFGTQPFGPDPYVFHVITGSDDAILDGFTVRRGVALEPYADGGGMYNVGVSPTVRNCTFTENTAQYTGAAMFNDEGAAPLVVNCTFIDNNATYAGAVGNQGQSAPVFVNARFIRNYSFEGAGIRNEESTTTIVNGLFLENHALYDGGAIANLANASITLINTTLFGNDCIEGYMAGGIYNRDSVVSVVNSVLWNNPQNTNGSGQPSDACPSSEICNYGTASSSVSFSLLEGGCELVAGAACGAGNLDTNPQFFDTGADDFRPLLGSPLVDAGDNAALPADVGDVDEDGDIAEALPLDLAGVARIEGGVVDMGAYEGPAPS